MPRLFSFWLPALVAAWLAQGASAAVGPGGALDGLADFAARLDRLQ